MKSLKYIIGTILLTGIVLVIISSLGFIIMSIICTGGVALAVWVPLFLGLGILFKFILRICFDKTYTNNKPQNISSSKEELAIIDYIVSSRNTGMMDDIIKLKLKETGGWSDEEIEGAFVSSSNKI
ncbi:MAG: hypothetical protein PHN69_01620 [Candidatus Pacebacteria bacterium]|nr:hypothetical protein [Candidatus Paceibacterota bacterium]